MATSKAQKMQTLGLLQNDVSHQTAVVFLTTLGTNASLTASSNFSIRSKANSHNVGLKVVKNTLIKLAFGKAEGFPEELVGPTYVVYAKSGETDEVAVPKAIVDIVSEEFKDNFKILGSVVNGQFYDSAKTIQLANTPSKIESMATLAGMLQTIAGGKIASLVKEISAQTARAIGEVAKTKTA